MNFELGCSKVPQQVKILGNAPSPNDFEADSLIAWGLGDEEVNAHSIGMYTCTVIASVARFVHVAAPKNTNIRAQP